MRITKVVAGICMIPLVGVVFLVASSYMNRSTKVTAGQLGFPYELRDEVHTNGIGGEMWTARVLIPRNHLSRENLDRLFLSFSAAHPNIEERLTVTVYTDIDRLNERRIEGEPSPNATEDKIESIRYAVPYDAIFFRGGDGVMAGGGENAWYIYRPEASEPSKAITIVLRGKDPSAHKNMLALFESTNKSVKYRIIVYELENVQPKGTYYTLQSPEDNHSWRSVMTIQGDDSSMMPSDNFRVLPNGIGYGFLGWKYAVTLDRGDNWFIWDAERELPNWNCCDAKLIESVTVSSDGTGIMTLSRGTAQGRELYTQNFGRHWQFNK